MRKERLYLSICWFIYKFCLKPHPQLTNEKFSLISAARISPWKRKHHISLSVSSIILNQKTFMTSKTLYIKQCYEGFNIYIAQIPVCLKVFKGAMSSTFIQPRCSLVLGCVCNSSHPCHPKSFTSHLQNCTRRKSICHNLPPEVHFHIAFSFLKKIRNVNDRGIRMTLGCCFGVLSLEFTQP